MDIKKEYLMFFGFFIVILLLNSIKNRYNDKCLQENYRETESNCEEKNSINGSKNNSSSEYEFLGGSNDKSNIQSNSQNNFLNNSQNGYGMNDCMDYLNCLPGKDTEIKKSSNCPSCVNKCPEVIKNSGKLVVEISELLKKCKKEEKIAEKIIKDNIKTIKNCIKQDLKYKQIAKNYDEAIRILSENIEVCERNRDNTMDLDSQMIDKNLTDLIDEIY